MVKKLFAEIEERKQYFERMEAARKRQKRSEAEKQRAKEEIIKEDMRAWEDTREGRVKSWQDFTEKKSRLERKKKIKFGTRAPQVQQEMRPDNAPKDETFKPMGLNEDYKRSWK